MAELNISKHIVTLTATYCAGRKSVTKTFALNGAAIGDYVIIKSRYLTGGFEGRTEVTLWVSDTNVITMRITNSYAGMPVTLVAGDYEIILIKKI